MGIKRKAEGLVVENGTTKRKPLPLDPHKLEKSREAHAKSKQQLHDRKSSKPHAELITRIKSLWSQLNRKTVKKVERQQLIEKLYKLIEGKVVEIIFKHDASRVIQASFKYGTPIQRASIVTELKGHFVELSKATYGKFLVLKMLEHGTAEQKATIIGELHGKVRKLIRNKEAAYVVEDAFREFATPEQQNALLSELYGAEFALFGNQKSLEEVIRESPEKRDVIMKTLWESIEASVKKGSIGFTIIHRALSSYLSLANAPEQAECVELVKELLPEIVHTKDGSRVACVITAIAAAKDRKAIMKSFREHLVKAMEDEYGFQFAIALFQCVDDTVLLTKAFSDQISKSMLELFENKNARKVLSYLLNGQGIDFVDELKVKTSKKDDTLRREEILASIHPAIITTMTDNLQELLQDPSAASFLLDILMHGGDIPIDSLISTILENPKDHHPRLLKTLVQRGHYNKSTGRIEVTSKLDIREPLKKIVVDDISKWLDEFAFVIVALIDSDPTFAESIKSHREKFSDDKGGRLVKQYLC